MESPRVEKLVQQWEMAQRLGQGLTLEELCAECPELVDDVRVELARLVKRDAVTRQMGGEDPNLVTRVLSAEGEVGEATVPAGYEILGELGRGGMGVVYRARQRTLNRLCALKMILAGGHAREIDRVRFLAEAEALARVRHPGIVQIYDFGTCEGLPFLSLELCAGESLAERLREHPLPAREAAELMEQVARAIQAAHEVRIVHRDLKPGNILFTDRGEPKVTDFGLAKKLDEEGHTQTGDILGTPSYMAPEQAEGRRDIGPGADIYALGAILYECLTSRPPFRAALPYETMLQVKTEEPVSVRQLNRQVPADLETIAHRCLQKDPAKRYATAQALADDLGRYLRGEPIMARPVGAVERAVKWVRVNRTVSALTAALVLALTAGVGVSSWFAYQAWEEARIAREAEKEERMLRHALQMQKAQMEENLRLAQWSVQLGRLLWWVLREDSEKAERKRGQAAEGQEEAPARMERVP